MNVRSPFASCVAALIVVTCWIAPFAQAADATGAAAKRNILWFVVDDMSPTFSCYGETLIKTPSLDQLAAEGTLFKNAHVTAPVCSPCRSAMITGMYQTTIGSQNHRSGRGELKINLPEGVVPVPKLFQDAGYFTCIGSGLLNADRKGGKGKPGALGKSDYNFEWDPKIYDSNDWAGRKPNQPFFMQVQTAGGKLRHADTFRNTAKQSLGTLTDPKAVTLPPYYPDDPVIRQDWADFLDACRMTDKHVGEVVARLKKENLYDNTSIIFMTDHGISHARGKQFLYDEGTHIGFFARGPGIPVGVVREDMVLQIDMAPTSLALAGLPIPPTMQGQDIFAKSYQPRDAIFAARDRCDETVDHIRSVRTAQYKYIRNYLDQRPMLQPNRYKDAKEIVQRIRELHEQGKLTALQEKLLFSPTRPKEELYDLKADPNELNNLAGDPAHAQVLADLRKRLAEWETRTDDKGRVPEATAMYDSDMAEYLRESKGKGKESEALGRNIALMKQWAAEGK